MRIYDKQIIKSLYGHNSEITVVRYFRKNKIKDYILSCDFNNSVIIWDIQNNYNCNQKLEIREQYFGYIWDALLLFNINKNNYILLSSDTINVYSELY